MSQLTNKSMLRQDTYQCKDIINTYFIMIVTNFIYFLNIITVLTLNSTFSLQMYFYVKKKKPVKRNVWSSSYRLFMLFSCLCL